MFGLKWEEMAGSMVGWEGWDQKFIRNFVTKASREKICMDGTLMLKCRLRNRVEVCAMDLSDSG